MSSEPLAALAALSSRVARTAGLDERLEVALEELDRRFGHAHTMLLVPEGEERLVLLACRGYPSGGVGAELRMGEGAIGVAAERGVPVSIANVFRGMNMFRAAQARVPGLGHAAIPLPGLANVASQLAVPGVVDGRVVVVVYTEDPSIGRFAGTDELVLQIVANQLASYLLNAPDDEGAGAGGAEPLSPGPSDLVVRYFAADGSVFFGDEYVIKSLPGRILRKLIREHLDDGRTEFSKKELRLDPELQLPPVRDNLDTRLILLRRRLEERFPFMRIEASGRGRFKLTIGGRVRLEERA
jgi:adenylate cyclase